MASPTTLNEEFVRIRDKIGPLPVVGLDDYLEKLRAEIRLPEHSRQYVEWIMAQEEDDDPVFLPPEAWLEELRTTDLSTVRSAINIRSALSFKEVDQLILAVDEAGDQMYLVTSEPAALKLGQVNRPRLNPPSGSQIHPALLCLSASGDPQPAPFPMLVLPAGRLRCGQPSIILENVLDNILQRMRMRGEDINLPSLGQGTLPNPISYFQDLLSDDPKLLSYLEPNPNEKKVLVEYFEKSLLYKDQPDRLGRNADLTDQGALELKLEYTGKIINILKGDVPGMSREKLEGKRRELWGAVLRVSPGWKDTNYAVVIDAVTPGSPVWLVHNPDQEEDDDEEDEINSLGKRISIEPSSAQEDRAYAVQIFEEAREWLESYGKLDSDEITRKIGDLTSRCSVVVSTIDKKVAGELFSKARET